MGGGLPGRAPGLELGPETHCPQQQAEEGSSEAEGWHPPRSVRGVTCSFS